MPEVAIAAGASGKKTTATDPFKVIAQKTEHEQLLDSLMATPTGINQAFENASVDQLTGSEGEVSNIKMKVSDTNAQVFYTSITGVCVCMYVCDVRRSLIPNIANISYARYPGSLTPDMLDGV